MKWYHSIKIKMIGFFLFVSAVFLVSIVAIFFMIRTTNLPENASKEAAVMTRGILQTIKSKQIRAEDTVLSLAAIGTLLEKHFLHKEEIIPTFFSGKKQKDLGLISGGIWFEPSGSQKQALFFNHTPANGFVLIEKYAQKTDYTAMAFYQEGKKLQNGETAWTEVYIDPVTQIQMITVVSPIYRNSTFLGVASIDLAIDNRLLDMIEQQHLIDANRYLIMLDREGNFIGKSKQIGQITSRTNIFAVKNASLQKIVRYIKPVLRQKSHTDNLCNTGKTQMQNREKEGSVSERIIENICMVKDDPVLKEDTILAIYHFPQTHWSVVIGIPQAQVLAKTNELFYNVLLITVLMTLFATILGYYILQKIFVRPIASINEQLILASSEHTMLQCSDRGEIGMLIDNLNTRTVKLAEAKERESKEHQLRKTQEEMLIQQSKMAMIGEMMDSVAHQWKQPLNALMLYSELIRNDFEEGNVNQAYIEKFRKDIQLQIDHMVNTLDEFRSFFRPGKERHDFKLLDVVNSALFLAKDDILKNRILVKITHTDEIVLNGSENEFKHLILNIINNAKDAFVERSIQKRSIVIRLIGAETPRLEIEDNAGGIPEEIIDHIFDANITTKEEGKGTGIGLYMSRRIAQKHHAELSVENRENGACFIVLFLQNSQSETETPAR